MLAVSVGFLVLATIVWFSGEDMLIGSMLLVVTGGWGLAVDPASCSGQIESQRCKLDA